MTRGDPDYVCIDPDKPLPFADESFDAVAALEVLEHVPAERRAGFMADCLRVARPRRRIHLPERYARSRGGRATSRPRRTCSGTANRTRFLREHVDFGLPREDEVRDILQRLDVPFAVVPECAARRLARGNRAVRAAVEAGARTRGATRTCAGTSEAEKV